MRIYIYTCTHLYIIYIYIYIYSHVVNRLTHKIQIKLQVLFFYIIRVIIEYKFFIYYLQVIIKGIDKLISISSSECCKWDISLSSALVKTELNQPLRYVNK